MGITPALLGVIGGSGGGAAGSLVALDSVNLSSAATSITFTSSGSSSPWTDFYSLQLVWKGRSSNATSSNSIMVGINSTSGTTYYKFRYWMTHGTNAGTTNNTYETEFEVRGMTGATSPTYHDGVGVMDFYNHDNSTRDMGGHWHTMDPESSTGGRYETTAFRWDYDAVATSIELTLTYGGSFNTGTYVSLYGYKNTV